MDFSLKFYLKAKVGVFLDNLSGFLYYDEFYEGGAMVRQKSSGRDIKWITGITGAVRAKQSS